MQNTRYTFTAIALHWLIALLIFVAFGFGLSLDDMPLSPTKLHYISYHKWLGITVLGLVALRLIWRQFNKPPALPEMPRWQGLAASAGHHTLYLLMFAVPLLGWLYSSAAGFPVVYLGLVQLPDLLAKNKALADTLKEVHGTLAWIMMVIVALHILAALKHQFWDKDGLLKRMSFWQ